MPLLLVIVFLIILKQVVVTASITGDSNTHQHEYALTLAYSLPHSLTHSLTHSNTQTLTHSLIQTLKYLLTHYSFVNIHHMRRSCHDSMTALTSRGFVVSVVRDLGLPVKFIGVGEKIDDLRDFQAEDFVDALLGNDEATSVRMRARVDKMFNVEGSGSGGMKAMALSSAGSSQSSDPSARLRASFNSGGGSSSDDDDDDEDDTTASSPDKPKRAKRPKPQSSKKKTAKKDK